MEKDFDLRDFLPYLLNQAADASSLEFQQLYKSRYGLLRTEWRVLFHLGRYGEMTAKDICDRARIHKTKISRAVASLETKHYIACKEIATDRRHNELSLTKQGKTVFRDLISVAEKYDRTVRESLTEDENLILNKVLIKLAHF